MIDRSRSSALLASMAILCACDGASSDDREPFPGAWSSTGSPGQRIVYLWYADGADPPTMDRLCAGRRPPPFACTFATSRGACQAAVQVYLERWYRSFPVHFTLVPVPASIPHDTLIISGDGGWCGHGSAGLAPVTCDT